MSKTLGIAFGGGGGAEAIAGIAYVKAIEELGIEPAVVSGTGIGGVIAAMYAAGMKSANMTDFLNNVNFPGAKKPISESKVKDAKYGILDDMGLEDYFRMIVPVKVFDRLYFPLKIVAAYYDDGREVVFSQGDVGRAVRAGVSIPGIFSPHETEETFYIDGSCVNPVPFDVIRSDCDVLAAIDPFIIHTSEGEEGEQELSLSVFSVFKGSYNAAKRAITTEKLKSCKVDIYERAAVRALNSYDFVQHVEIISSVQEQAEAFKEKVKKALGG